MTEMVSVSVRGSEGIRLVSFSPGEVRGQITHSSRSLR